MNRLLTAGPPRPCVPSARETSVSPGVERFPKRRKNSRRNTVLGQQGRWHANITALQHIQVAGAVNEDDRGRRPSGRAAPGARIGEVVSSPCPKSPAVEACFPVSPSSPRLCGGGQGDGIPKRAARAKDVTMHVLNKVAARCSKGASGIVTLLVVGIAACGAAFAQAPRTGGPTPSGPGAEV